MAQFAVGEPVQVKARAGPGENKHGGVAIVQSHDPSTDTYVVKYVLGGSEAVAACYVEAVKEETLGRPRNARQRQSPEDIAENQLLQEAIRLS